VLLLLVLIWLPARSGAACLAAHAGFVNDRWRRWMGCALVFLQFSILGSATTALCSGVFVARTAGSPGARWFGADGTAALLPALVWFGTLGRTGSGMVPRYCFITRVLGLNAADWLRAGWVAGHLWR
jgi:hypothetical protein